MFLHSVQYDPSNILPREPGTRKSKISSTNQTINNHYHPTDVPQSATDNSDATDIKQPTTGASTRQLATRSNERPTINNRNLSTDNQQSNNHVYLLLLSLKTFTFTWDSSSRYFQKRSVVLTFLLLFDDAPRLAVKRYFENMLLFHFMTCKKHHEAALSPHLPQSYFLFWYTTYLNESYIFNCIENYFHELGQY
jgi:hypothetical protein